MKKIIDVYWLLAWFLLVKGSGNIAFKDDDYQIKPSPIMFLNTGSYVESFDGGIKWMNFLIKDDDLLK